MKFSSIEETVRKRISVRTYDRRPLTAEDRRQLMQRIEEVCSEDGPFPVNMRISILESGKEAGTGKLGTYGVIRGADTFLCVTAEDSGTVMEAIGYNFEKLVLAATEMGLGTCWIAGTLNRENFANALEIGEKEIFPIISPIGYPAEKSSFVGTMFSTFSKARSRKDFGEVFRKDDFGSALTEADAGDYAFPLEMLRLAPSAANRQPWRVVLAGKDFHFYKEIITGSKVPFDLQRLDVGIAACHFHLAAMEKNLEGSFVKTAPDIEVPDNLEYMFTWKVR